MTRIKLKKIDNWKTALEQYMESFVLFEIVCIQQADKKLSICKRRMICWTNVQLIMYTNKVVEHKMIRWTTVTEVGMESKQRKTTGRIVLGFDRRWATSGFELAQSQANTIVKTKCEAPDSVVYDLPILVSHFEINREHTIT